MWSGLTEKDLNGLFPGALRCDGGGEGANVMLCAAERGDREGRGGGREGHPGDEGQIKEV